MEPKEQLNADLARRLQALEAPGHADSECMASAKPVFIEAIAWTLGALLLWIASVLLL